MVTDSQVREALSRHGSKAAAARALEIPVSTFKDRVAALRKPDRNLTPAEAALAAQVAKLRRDNASLTRQLGNWELLVNEFIKAAPTVYFPGKPKMRQVSVADEQEMVAVLSDCHAGSQWTAEQVDGNSSYNFDHFCRNLWFFGQEIIRFAHEFRPKYGCRVLHIDCLGDIVHGVLRVEDEVTNHLAIIPLCVQTAKVLVQWLAGLAEHFERIEFVGIPGNHGRQARKPESKRFTDTNYDTLTYLILRELVKASGADRHAHIRVPQSRIITMDRLGHRVRLLHGDTIHGGNGISSIPLYGISRDSLRAFRKELRKNGGKLSLIELGHFHVPSLLEGSVLMNGAMCPPDPYASDELGASSDPAQWVYLTGREHCYSWMLPVALKCAPLEHGIRYDADVMDVEVT